jgi:hypothetical protein
MYVRSSLAGLAAVTMLMSQPAAAEPAQRPPAAQPGQTEKAKDPNEMICERQQDPGSRLAAAKVCHTRAEWADLRHQDRQMIDRAQTQIGAMGK